tara:strand:- start:121 stop:822 length:702 start_codon:yes stop_codon:yes gene_type:complete
MSYSRNNVNTIENKKMLWELLVSKISTKDFDYKQFQEHLDNTCQFYSKNTNDTINATNKLILENCFNYIQKSQMSLEKPSDVISGRKIIKANNKLSKEDEFNKKFSQHQKTYNKLFQKKKPEDVDFSDKLDEPISAENIETIVKKEIETRNNHLQQISQNYIKDKKVDQWLNKDENEKNNIISKTNIKDKEIFREKNNKQIIELLYTILDNQKKIFTLLEIKEEINEDEELDE